MKDQLTIPGTNLFFAIFMMSYVSLSVVVGLLLPEDIPMWMSMILSEVVILLPVMILLLVRRMNPLKFLGLSKVNVGDFIKAYVAAYCLLPLIYCINYATMLFADNHVNDLVSDLYQYPLAVQVILMALLPALVEEFIFRGIFYGSYRRKNMLIAALASGLFFGVAHMNINQFAYAFVIGVAFCILYEASGNIFISVTAHFAINANTVFMMALAKFTPEDLEMAEEQMQEAEAIPLAVNLLVILLLLGIGLLGVYFFSLLVRSIAKNHGRTGFWQNARERFKKREWQQPERVLDLVVVATVLASVVYMVLLEI